MYAIIETGGKQYKVAKDDEFEVEYLGKKEGSTVNISRVLVVNKNKKVYIGSPHVKKAKLICQVTENKKGKKIQVFKYRRRKNSKSKSGHRQMITRLKVKEIDLGDK
jgi:large subunit ribosomal protein L21